MNKSKVTGTEAGKRDFHYGEDPSGAPNILLLRWRLRVGMTAASSTRGLYR
ncbi:MAG: hypothetical protein KAU03_04785 [Candidatus Altiarchaeales archaeon]|nr:hypothetical protein [Candidatus Altiarchaeales archaeon]